MGGKRGKKRRGRCARRNKSTTVKDIAEPEEFKKAPHTFVIHRGEVGRCMRELVREFRKVMEPFTASSLRVLKKNTMKDFVSVAGLLHVTHFCIFTHTDIGVYLKIARVPRGPTLSFRVHNYTLARDVISTLKKQLVFSKQFEHSPLLVLNGFTGEGMHMKLMASTFQNMFPTINLLKVDLSNIRRCVLLNYDATSNLIDFRHYAIKVVPAGISKSVKKIVQSKVPNMSHYQDISQYITNPTHLSESEAEDDPASHVVLPQTLSSRGNMASGVSAIRLVEIGPRLTLQLLKLESGLLGGDVLYHDLIEKSNHEVKLMKKNLTEKRNLKENRKRIQEENVKKKEKKKQLLKERSIKGMKAKYGHDGHVADSSENKQDNEAEEEDDDAEWYKEEIGQDPDPDLFTTTTTSGIKRKKPLSTHFVRRKKVKEAAAAATGSLRNSKTKQFTGRSEKMKMGTRKKERSKIYKKRNTSHPH